MKVDSIEAALRGLIRSHGQGCQHGCCAAVNDGLAAIAELAELRRGKARLDWMLADCIGRKVYVRDYDEDTGKYTYICKGQRADTPYAAIDAAMERK